MHYILYNAQCALHTVQCYIVNVHCTMYIMSALNSPISTLRNHASPLHPPPPPSLLSPASPLQSDYGTAGSCPLQPQDTSSPRSKSSLASSCCSPRLLHHRNSCLADDSFYCPPSPLGGGSLGGGPQLMHLLNRRRDSMPVGVASITASTSRSYPRDP